MTRDEAEARYGKIAGGWAQEVKWCSKLPVPVELEWINTATGHRISSIYCNEDLHTPLSRALQQIIDWGIQDQLKTLDGCYNIRDVRGLPGKLSAHAYALAIDINAATNRLNTPGDISKELAQCFLDQGFKWGKDFTRMDPMHFSLLGW